MKYAISKANKKTNYDQYTIESQNTKNSKKRLRPHQKKQKRKTKTKKLQVNKDFKCAT